MTLLEISGLAVERGGACILRGVELQVAAGEILQIGGPNGVGKTTLLRTVAGLQDPLEGHVKCDPDSVAYASHKDGVKSALTVEENLEFWARIYGKTVSNWVFDAFDLRQLRRRLAATLSAGQSRRLGLARLAVIERKLLLLDEPTVSLDRKSVALFADFILKHHLAAGGAALIATHIDIGIEMPSIDLEKFVPNEPVAVGGDEAFL
jgi:heme exporter protein A